MQRVALAALTLAAATGIPAHAQDLEIPTSGRQSTLTATISQSAVADSNYNLNDPSPGTSYYGDTRFTLDYLRDTRNQTLGLGIDTGIRPLWEAEENFDVVLASPSTAYLTFRQEGANTAFDANLRTRARRVDYLGDLGDLGVDGEVDPGALAGFQEDTYEVRSDANIGFTLGTNAPSSYEFRVIGTSFDYPDDPDPENANSLVPRRSVEGQASWTLAITPVFSTIVFGSYYYYNSDVQTDDTVRVAEAEAGLVYNPSDVLRLRGGLGYADRNREELNGAGQQIETQHDTGLTVRGDVRYILPEWTLVGDARWTAAAPSPRLSGSLRAVYNLSRGTVIGRVFQRYTGGQGGDEVRVTGAAVGLTHDLNTRSQIGIDAAYAVQVNQDNPNDANIDRTDFTASYSYDVTQTVSAEIGYGYRHKIEDPDDANSHRLFLVVGKSFETGL